MNVSLYLKRQLLAERKIAQSLEKGIQQSFISAGKTLDDIYHGAERISWYSSCFIDKHHDVCRQLKSEDVRMCKALLLLYKRKDVIAEIFQHYINYLLQNMDIEQTKVIAVKMFGFNIEMLNAKTTNKVLAYTLAKGISESIVISATVRSVLNTTAFNGFSFIQFYGKAQKSALAARRLKVLEPKFYKILYQANIEMLYIYVEPVFYKIVTEIKALPDPHLEDIIDILKRSIS